MNNPKSRHYKKILILLGLVFLITGVVFHSLENWPAYRTLRGVTVFGFLFLLLLFHRMHAPKFIVIFLLFYGISSFLSVYYENSVAANGMLVTNIISFLVLIAVLMKKVSLKKMGVVMSLIFIIMAGVNSYLCYLLVLTFKDLTFGGLHLSLIYFHSIVLLFMCFLALLYNFIHSSKATLLFVVIAVFIVFAEVLRAIAYYELAFDIVAVYVSRILVLLIGAGLVHYSMLEKPKIEELTL